jgi:hypothetical protein
MEKKPVLSYQEPVSLKTLKSNNLSGPVADCSCGSMACDGSGCNCGCSAKWIAR